MYEKYIWGVTYYICHVKDAHFVLVTFHEKGAARGGNVCPSQHLNEFGRVSFTHLLNLEHVTD